jgi:flagellar basal body-associated protein FliL
MAKTTSKAANITLIAGLNILAAAALAIPAWIYMSSYSHCMQATAPGTAAQCSEAILILLDPLYACLVLFGAAILVIDIILFIAWQVLRAQKKAGEKAAAGSR